MNLKIKLIIVAVIGSILVAAGIACLILAAGNIRGDNNLTAEEIATMDAIAEYNGEAECFENASSVTSQWVQAQIGDSLPIVTVTQVPILANGADTTTSYTAATFVSAEAILNSSAQSNPSGVAIPIAFSINNTVPFSRSNIPFARNGITSSALCTNTTYGCSVSEMVSWCAANYPSNSFYNGTGCTSSAPAANGGGGLLCGICVYSTYLSSYCAVLKFNTEEDGIVNKLGDTNVSTASPTTAVSPTTVSPNTTSMTGSSTPAVTSYDTTTWSTSSSTGSSVAVSTTVPTTSSFTVVPPPQPAPPTFAEDLTMPSCRFPFGTGDQHYLSLAPPTAVVFQVVLSQDPMITLARLTNGTGIFGPLPPSSSELDNRWRNDTATISYLVLGILASAMGLVALTAMIVSWRATSGSGAKQGPNHAPNTTFVVSRAELQALLSSGQNEKYSSMVSGGSQRM
eukprot:GILI01026339.1.p1 GENE.GILI01026339.1~~GILI01026339.1.p1  ORF type:complete len:455 (+),score=52.12 GILI01026339.1:105-1469(+)